MIGKKNSEICCPLWGQPIPRFLKHTLSGPITNHFLRNLQKLVLYKETKNEKKMSPPFGVAPPAIFSNNINYFISVTIMNEYRWNFQKWVHSVGDEKLWKNTEICYPHLEQPQQPQPPILKHHYLGQLCINLFQIFRKKVKICHPLLGQPHPHIIKHLIYRAIMNRYVRNF